MSIVHISLCLSLRGGIIFSMETIVILLVLTRTPVIVEKIVSVPELSWSEAVTRR